MRIIWSDFASEILIEIYTYYSETANVIVARKIKTNIFSATKQLIKHPNLGKIEETLLKLNQGHRYLVEGNFKIVYKIVRGDILITDIFDTRQNPHKINDDKRKSNK